MLASVCQRWRTAQDCGEKLGWNAQRSQFIFMRKSQSTEAEFLGIAFKLLFRIHDSVFSRSDKIVCPFKVSKAFENDPMMVNGQTEGSQVKCAVGGVQLYLSHLGVDQASPDF